MNLNQPMGVQQPNICISNTGEPLITDFGLSHVIKTASNTSFSVSMTNGGGGGTVRWMAPELINGDNEPTVQSDVWAFGMVVYVCVSFKLSQW